MKKDLRFRWALPLALAVNLFAQAGHPTAPTSPTSPNTTSNPGMGTTNSRLPSSSNPNYPDQFAQPLYLSGKVVMEDGTPPPEPVVIRLHCQAYPRPIAYTDAKGYFSANVSDKIGNQLLADASDPFGAASVSGAPAGANPVGSSNIGARDLMGCTVEASLAGFRSSSIEVGMHQALDNSNIGTLFLRRMANVE